MTHLILNTCTGCTACVRRCPVNAIQGARNDVHEINAQLCIDCGVCGLICPVDAVTDQNNHIVMHQKPSHWLKPSFYLSRCSACRICVQVCPMGCLSIRPVNDGGIPGLPYLREAKVCIACSFCVEVCYLNVVHMEDSE
jgi:Na+-translocating ferredoxin:NAD+ oxidoreductase subunit B